MGQYLPVASLVYIGEDDFSCCVLDSCCKLHVLSGVQKLLQRELHVYECQ